MILSIIRSFASVATLIGGLTFSDPSISLAYGPGVVFEENTSNIKFLKSCPATSNCVSSNYSEPPNRYISPLKVINERDVAFQRAVRSFRNQEDINVVEISPKEFYIHVTVEGTVKGTLDDIELYFPEAGGIVALRCEARNTLPPPPFCIKKGCINGNMDERKRIERVASVLGLPFLDQEEMQGAKWTPIFFNSDKVPGFDELV
jgi:uncharacterized protein (DUF1499 family)